VLSHDWPTTIPRHGDTKALLRRKPFFEQEVKTNSLGSPPLLELMKEIQPEHWFSAHLHVKFAAVYEHVAGTAASSSSTTAIPAITDMAVGENPDEIDIDDDDIDEEPAGHGHVSTTALNPDEIGIEDDDFDSVAATVVPPTTAASAVQNPDEIDIADDEFDAGEGEKTVDDSKPTSEVVSELEVDESVDLVEQARKEGEVEATVGVIGSTDVAIPAIADETVVGHFDYVLISLIAAARR